MIRDIRCLHEVFGRGKGFSKHNEIAYADRWSLSLLGP